MRVKSRRAIVNALRRAMAIGAVSIAATAAAAQDVGTIEGRVIGANSGAPLADVIVRVTGSARGAIADGDGRFRLPSVPAGRREIVAARMGLGEWRDSITVTANSVARIEIRMADAASVIAPVVVSATRESQRRTETAAAIEVLDGLEVRRTRAAHPANLMNRLAGVHVSELSGEGHSMAIRQAITTKPMYLFLEDGVPTRATGFFNHNALYEVNIPQSGGVEVLKGPGTALYGSDAIGGVVNVLTRPAPPTSGAEVAVEGGGYGYTRLLASGGTSVGLHGLRADLNITRSDNWKDLAPFDRQSGTVRWDYFGTGGMTAKTVVTASNIDQQDVPSLSVAQFDTNRTLNRAPIAFRKVQAVRASSALEWDRGAHSFSVTPFARYNVLELLPSWQLTYDPQTWDQRNTSVGMLMKYRRDFAPWNARLILGTDADWSPGSFEARQAVTSPNAGVFDSYTDGEIHYDYDVTYRAVSPYAHLELSPVPRVRVELGLRSDFAGYDYENRLTPLDSGAHRRPASTSVNYSRVSPKVGATMELAREANLFASVRQGFRAPSQGQLFQQNSAANTIDLRPVKVMSYETGLRGQLGDRMVYQLAAYDMRIEDDIITFITPTNARVATNAGETRHRGIEGSIGAAVHSTLRLDASYSVARHTYEEWAPSSTVDFSGNRVEQAPRSLGSLLATYSPSLLRGGRLAAEWTHTGRYAMDPANTHEYGGHTIVSLHANYFVRPEIELFARVINLQDRAYAELASYDAFQREQFTPGAPRTVFAGLQYRWSR
jgi:outer membrane cobalamin receptor